MQQVFIRWTWLRAVLHNGWWLVTSVYLVVDAGLSPAQLVLIGSVQGGFSLVFEVPAGVIADTISRKWSLVISQVLMGTAMVTTGLVTAFPALLATQVLWGISWTFASGSDVALITDELDDELDGISRINLVLARAARAQLTGAGRLTPRRLLDLGLPTAPILWFTVLGVIGLVLGAVVLRLLTHRINRSGADYALAAVVGVVSMLLLAFARDPVVGAAAVVLLNGIVTPLTRVISTIWVNARTTAEVRATTHSFLAQLEYLGEIVCGLTISAIASVSTMPLALVACAVLFAATAVLMRQPTNDEAAV
ncbi:hypothetical protein GCM10009630_71140 [Kribbella jejuensis]|uniref:MFS transporter n=1 Tax=Kribbella jejuensis TaxID=236068 RepID=A0A542DBB6_9ACTN|nr:MFS transporter [Kribbella jejuensis]TQJ00370.1 hypothetical protein FB475_7367 [Kribbella jejuensis]